MHHMAQVDLERLQYTTICFVQIKPPLHTDHPCGPRLRLKLIENIWYQPYHHHDHVIIL